MQDDDLRPPRPVKKTAAAPVVSMPKEKTADDAAEAAQPQTEAGAQAEEAQTPRRRRRSAPAQTASLTLIRSDQAQ